MTAGVRQRFTSPTHHYFYFLRQGQAEVGVEEGLLGHPLVKQYGDVQVASVALVWPAPPVSIPTM